LGAVAGDERILEVSQSHVAQRAAQIARHTIRTSYASSDNALWQRLAGTTVAHALPLSEKVATLGGQTGDESSNETNSANVSAFAAGVMLV
jgi:hypothetical protein